MKTYIGIDIGGTKIEVLLLSPTTHKDKNTITINQKTYSIIERERIKTDRDSGYEKVLSNISEFIISLYIKSNIDRSTLQAIGIGMPGSVDLEVNQMTCGNTAIFENQDLAGDLNKELEISVPITLANDANLFAYAETLIGETQETNTISIGVILGTGCGAGVIINGKMVSGNRGAFAELGHTVLKVNGRQCYCGNKGCAETYISGTGLETTYKEMFPNNIALSSREIFESNITEVISEYKKDLTHFLLNLVNTFDPDKIFLGGGVSNQEIIYDELNKKISEQAFIKNHPVKIHKSSLGDSAGVFGAAILAINSQV